MSLSTFIRFSRLSVLIDDHAQVRKILRIWCNHALNPHRPKKCLLTVHQFATAFIHLLSPALDTLSSSCLPESWQSYISSRSTPHGNLLIVSLVSALCSRLDNAQYFLLIRCRTRCFSMGYCTFGSHRPHARSVFDDQTHQGRLAQPSLQGATPQVVIIMFTTRKAMRRPLPLSPTPVLILPMLN